MLEGCYGSLVRVALAFRPHLIWLDPGIERCLANCRSRPSELHKYTSPAEQDERLPFLLEWVAGYSRRPGELGREEHQPCFLAYDGPRIHLRQAPRRDALPPEFLG
jgi:hypothetical protein